MAKLNKLLIQALTHRETQEVFQRALCANCTLTVQQHVDGHCPFASTRFRAMTDVDFEIYSYEVSLSDLSEAEDWSLGDKLAIRERIDELKKMRGY